MRIAVLQTSALGDCLLATAVIHELWKQGNKVTWLVFDEYREVPAGCFCCEDYIAWPLRPGVKRQIQEHDAWATMLAYAKSAFPQVIVPQIYPFYMPWDRPERQGVTMLDQMFMNAGIEPPQRPRMCYQGKARDRMKLRQVCVNRKSNTQAPVWSDKQWDEFTELVAPLDVVVGEEAGMDLAEWHAEIRSSLCYVGLDSGGSWLAATTDVPQFSIRSASNPRWFNGITESRVKDEKLVTELDDPEPAEVAELVRKLAWR